MFRFAFLFFLLFFNNSFAKNKLVGVLPLVQDVNSGVSVLRFDSYKQKYIKLINDNCENVTAIGLPSVLSKIDEYVELVDGILITGGKDNISSKYYGGGYEKNVDNTGKIDFFLNITKKMVTKKKPIIGICLGAQTMNVALGGTIGYINIDKDLQGKSAHFNQNAAYKYLHSVDVKKGTLLYKILQKNSITVNSVHEMSAVKIADGLKVSAVAKDGVVEAIEGSGDVFYLGLQWHPEEMEDDENSKKIIKAFCNAL